MAYINNTDLYGNINIFIYILYDFSYNCVPFCFGHINNSKKKYFFIVLDDESSSDQQQSPPNQQQLPLDQQQVPLDQQQLPKHDSKECPHETKANEEKPLSKTPSEPEDGNLYINNIIVSSCYISY